MENRPVTAHSGQRWRPWMLALCGLALVELGVAVIGMWPQMAASGLRGKATAVPFVDRLVVAPGSAAERAGLQTGDLVDVRDLSPAARVRLRYAARVGEPIEVIVRRGTGSQSATLVATQPATVPWVRWLRVAGIVWTIFFCALLTWRRAASGEVRVLVFAVLSVYALNVPLLPNSWITPWPALDLAASVVAGLLIWTGIALFVAYAMLFARPPSSLRRALAIATYATAAVAVLFSVAGAVELWNGTADPFQPAFTSGFARFVDSSLPVLLAVGCLFAAIVATRDAERARVTWASLAIAPLLLVSTFVSAAAELHLGIPPDATTLIFNIAGFIAPVVLSYSLLNRRLLDIGFVVNRAIVFSVVSIVLVGAFVLVEWALTDWLRDASHTTNILVAAGLALALGVSMRIVHTKVDQIVDAYLFRKRHQDEKALRMFAREAPYITDLDILLQRTAGVLEDHVDAIFAHVLLEDGQGTYGGASENDPAIVRLRATHEMLDLHGMATVVDGELAFPMVSRGRLVGVLALGPQRSGESYAPDEIDCIASIAQSVGSALDLLATRAGNEFHPVVEAISKLDNKVTALPTEIAEQLRTVEPGRPV